MATVCTRVGGSSYAARDYVQDERHFAMEHVDVRREVFQDCNEGWHFASSVAAPSYNSLTCNKVIPAAFTLLRNSVTSPAMNVFTLSVASASVVLAISR